MNVESLAIAANQGEEKREFINYHQFDDGSKNAKSLYLWTEKGAFLHAKSLNTDKASDNLTAVEAFFTTKNLLHKFMELYFHAPQN